LDITEKVELIKQAPTEEIVTEQELLELLETNSHPKHYIGLEVSGFLHLGSLISTGFKIKDFLDAGVHCTVFLADWHTLINDKLGGDWEKISKVAKYYEDAFKLVCPGVKIVKGSELYDSNKDYWTDLIRFSKHMTLARTKRALTIMGRSENDEKIDISKLLYPPMQAVDMHYLDVDIAQSGMDQRKIHMLAREIFPKMKWKVPVAVHQKLLPSLIEPALYNPGIEKSVSIKMSKSDPSSAIFIDDSDEVINNKIKKSWCQAGQIHDNPLLEIVNDIIFHKFPDGVEIERAEKFGGPITYHKYDELLESFEKKKLHPSDLKQCVSNYLVRIITPIRDKINLSLELRETIESTV